MSASNSAIAVLSKVRVMLEQAKGLDDFKAGIAMSRAAQALLRGVEDARATVLEASAFELRFQRRAGEWLKSQPKAKGGEHSHKDKRTGNSVLPVAEAPTLEDLGIEKIDAHRWQRLADVPAEAFESYISEAVGSGEQPTASGARKLAPPPSRPRSKKPVENDGDVGAADPETALADLEDDIEAHMLAWRWGPARFIATLEAWTRRARDHFETKDASNG